MNKISEKAVWDELVPSADEKTSSASFIQSAQPQMMFCYKCNQVIPANSAFCPWCQTELFVTCPKCGNKYSSQYPACNQCGTNLKVYMLEQEHLKEELIKKQRQEEERKRVEEEQRRLAEEQQRRLNVERARQGEIRQSQLRTRFLSENLEIIKTSEFIETENYIKKYITEYTAINGKGNSNLENSFVIHVKNDQINACIEPLIDNICQLIIGEMAPISLENDLTDSIILAYRKTYNVAYFDYYNEKIRLKQTGKFPQISHQTTTFNKPDPTWSDNPLVNIGTVLLGLVLIGAVIGLIMDVISRFS